MSIYRLIDAEKASYPVSILCRVLKVSRSGYYDWKGRPLSKRDRENADLTEQIREIHQRSRETYGYPRVHAELRALGVRCNRKRVAKLMQKDGLRGCLRGRRSKHTTRQDPLAVPAPDLVEGQVVVLDNLGAHRTDRVRELIEGRGCELVFLPSYSPDLNPIEEAFSKIKNLVRKAGERTREALNEAMAQALEAVTPRDVVGWFAHCGCYEARGQYL